MSELWRVFVIFGLSLWLGFTGAVLPGPMFAATVMHARRWGWRSGALVAGGHGLLEFALLIVIVSGAGAALSNPAVARSIAVAGGLFLVALGIMAIARPPAPPSSDAGDPGAGEAGTWMLSAGWWRPFLAGVWTSVTQPYWFIWWASLGASAVYAASGKAGAAGVGAFYVGHVLADVIWFTFVAAAIGAGRKVLSENAFRKLFLACGVMILGFGFLFMTVGAFYPGAFERENARPPAAASDAPSAEPAAAPSTEPGPMTDAAAPPDAVTPP